MSWKSTPVLNRRLERLIQVARDEHFKLSIIYQGLDFEREPLPVDAASRRTWTSSSSAMRTSRSSTCSTCRWWSGRAPGTSRRGRSRGSRRAGRGRLLILASERNTDAYRRLADVVDGDAYYWSSVNPDTFPGYEAKLREMGRAVHARGGLWIAPAAPGFDARLVGGTRVVAREGGATLRKQFAAAVGSSPDAVGLISWNEFSENSHVEPSLDHEERYVQVLGELTRAGAGSGFGVEADSSEPGDGPALGIPLLLGWIFLFFGGVVLLRRRGRRRH